MMNQEDLFKKIGSILNELQDQYEYLAQNSKQINELELELFFANASFLTDHVQILQKVNNSKPLVSIPEYAKVDPDKISTKVTSPGEATIQSIVEPVIEPIVESLTLSMIDPLTTQDIETVSESPVVDLTPQIEREIPDIEKEIFKLDDRPASFEFILNDKPSTDKFEYEEKPLTAIFDRPLSTEEQRIIEEKQKLHAYKERDLFADEGPDGEEFLEEPLEEAILNPADEVGPEPFLVIRKTPPTLDVNTPEPGDMAKPTLNDILAGNIGLHKNVNSDNRRLPVSDLKQAITLNQKLLFIKDLFNGYNLAYAEAIDLLNKMTDFKTADAFLQKNYAIKNEWASRQATTDQFYELLHQRFPGETR